MGVFAAKTVMKMIMSNIYTCDNRFECVKRNTDPKSLFVPSSGRDTSLDFYIDSINNEILQNDKKYKFTPNLSQEELEALNNYVMITLL